MVSQDPEASASFSFDSPSGEKNQWLLNLLLIVVSIVVALLLGFLGPFDGWVALVMAVVAAFLTYALIICLWATVWTVLAAAGPSRRHRKSLERDFVAQTGQPFPGWPKKRRSSKPPDGRPA